MIYILNEIPDYIVTVAIAAAIFYAVKFTRTFIHTKALHAKTVQSKELWNFLEQVSDTAVNAMVSKDLTGSEKFNQATKTVQTALNQQGFKNVDVKSIEAAVQAAYEKSPLTDNTPAPVEPTTPKPAQPTQPAPQATAKPDPVLEAIKQAPNRYNDVKEGQQ